MNKADIPLLISRAQLQKWGANLNFANNTLELGTTGDTVELGITTSGHLTLDLMNINNPNDKTVYLTEMEDEHDNYQQ